MASGKPGAVQCRLGAASRCTGLDPEERLFAGSDGGGGHWAAVASLVETCKLNGVNPQDWFADVLHKLANGHPVTRLDELLPWTDAAEPKAIVA